MNKYHVALITSHRLVGMVGGAERVLCDMANALIDRKYDVTIFCCDEKKGAPFFELNCHVAFVNVFNGVPFFSRQFFRNLRSFSFDKVEKYSKRKKIECHWKAKAFDNVLKKIDRPIDLFIAFDFESTYILRNLISLPTPVITMSHGTPSQGITTEKYALLNDAVNQCNALQVLMPEFISQCREVMKKVPIVYIPNVAPQYATKASLDNKKIICVSRYEPEHKRPALLVEAFALLKDKYPDWIVEFWGRFNGEKTEEVKKMVQKYGMHNQFILCGYTDRIVDKLQTASIFVLPSAVEAFGLSLVEAMAMGLPVVGCRDCCAVNSIIKNGSNGMLTDPTPESLANGIEKLIQSKTLREKMGDNGRKDVRQFSADVVWTKWDKLIQKIIRRENIETGEV